MSAAAAATPNRRLQAVLSQILHPLSLTPSVVSTVAVAGSTAASSAAAPAPPAPPAPAAAKPSKSVSVRSNYPYFLTVQTRWSDNDVYGHMNNAYYYHLFDTAINTFLITKCGLDIHSGAVIGLCIRSSCDFYDSFAFPESIECGVRLTKIGSSAVTYEVGLFHAADSDSDSERSTARSGATGEFVHVFVDRKTRRPTPVPAAIRDGLTKLKS